MWTKPYYGYQYLKKDKIFGMVCDYENFAITGIFSWESFKWSFEETFYKSDYKNYLEIAKEFIENKI